MSADVSRPSDPAFRRPAPRIGASPFALEGANILGWHCVDDHMVLDPKWRLIARRAGATVSQVRDVFLHMMSDASLSQLGGEMASWNDDVIAVNMDVETEVVTRIKEAMQALVVEGNTLKSWERRQPKRDYSTARVQNFRARQAAAQGLPAPQEMAGDGAPPHGELPAVIVSPPQPDPPPSEPPPPSPPLALAVAPKPSRVKPRRQIAEDEQPDAKQKQDASEAGLSIVEFRAEWSGFRDHHRSKGSVMADWPAAWRQWLRNRGRFLPRSTPGTATAREDAFVAQAKKLLGDIEDATASPGQVSAIASTLPDSAFGVAGDPFIEGSLVPDGSEILDLTPIRPGRPDESPSA